MSFSEEETELVSGFEEKRASDTERVVSTGSTSELRRRRSRKSEVVDTSQRSSSSRRKKRAGDESLQERVTRTWLVFLSVPIFLLLLSDLVIGGIHAEKNAFVVWWDVVGTVTFYRGRSPIFNLRDMPNNTQTLLWAAYVLFVEYMLYAGGGLISKSFLRGTVLLPTVGGLVDFAVQGFIPGHFSPYDYLSKVTADYSTIYSRRLGLLVAFAWTISKIKSFRPFVEEIEYIHGLDVASALLLSIASCEIGTVISKAEMNFFQHREELIQRMPGGIWAILTSTGFKASIVGSIFMYMAVKLHDVYVADLICSYLSFAAIFYKYSTGLVEQVYAENIASTKVINQKVQKLFSWNSSTKDWLEVANVAGKSLSAFRTDVTVAFAHSSQIWSRDFGEFARTSVATMQEKQAQIAEKIAAIDLKSMSHGMRWSNTGKWKWKWSWSW